MSSSYNLYKGNARKRKGKVAGESSQASAKKTKVSKPEVAAEIPSTILVVEVEDVPSRVATPEALVVEEPVVEEMDKPPSVFEPVAESTVEDVTQVFEKTISMTTDRAQKLAMHRKYSNSASPFHGYNFGQAFSRGLNDVTMVSSPRNVYFTFLPLVLLLTGLFRSCRACAL